MSKEALILVRLSRRFLRQIAKRKRSGYDVTAYRYAFHLTVRVLYELLNKKILSSDLDSLNVFLERSSLNNKIQKTLENFDGGPGSGNFGHRGRPGKVGGSAPKPDYDCSIAKACGKIHYDSIRDRVAACKDEKLRKVWYNNESWISLEDAHFAEGAHCVGSDVYLDIDEASIDSGEGSYSLFFHESGHAIDCLNAYLGEQHSFKIDCISASYKNGKFPESIEAEGREFIQRCQNAKKYSYEDACFELGQQLLKLDNVAPGQHSPVRDICDMLEGATNGDFCNFIGHYFYDKHYWDRNIHNGINFNLATEAFAEMTAATMTNPDSLFLIKSIFPKSYAIYQEILDVIIDMKH